MARRSIGYHPAARLEADDAFNWYWDRSLSAANQFQRELKTAQETIQESPESWAGTRTGRVGTYSSSFHTLLYIASRQPA